MADFYLDFSGFCFNGGLGWLGFSVSFFLSWASGTMNLA